LKRDAAVIGEQALCEWETYTVADIVDGYQEEWDAPYLALWHAI